MLCVRLKEGGLHNTLLTNQLQVWISKLTEVYCFKYSDVLLTDSDHHFVSCFSYEALVSFSELLTLTLYFSLSPCMCASMRVCVCECLCVCVCVHVWVSTPPAKSQPTVIWFWAEISKQISMRLKKLNWWFTTKKTFFRLSTSGIKRRERESSFGERILFVLTEWEERWS